jgi:endoglucanase
MNLGQRLVFLKLTSSKQLAALSLLASLLASAAVGCSDAADDGGSGATPGAGGVPGGSGGSTAGTGGLGLPNVGGLNAGGGVGTGSQSGTGAAPAVDPGIWINANGKVATGSNEFGIEGYWYAFGDGTTTTQSGNPWKDGKYCVSGTSTGAEGNWGAGIGIDLNGLGSEKAPFYFEGKVTGFRMKITGSIPSLARLSFVSDPDAEVSPFILVNPADAFVTYKIADALVPYTWSVENAGARVVGPNLYSLQLLAPGDSEAGPIELCIEGFEPIFDPNSPGGFVGTTYVNSEGFVKADSNTYGIVGPVYVITDGNSTTEGGVPYVDGKYCISGTFSGEEGDWGAGIALDLNRPPGGAKAPFDPTGKVAGFQIGITGSTPGAVRVQYIVNEPQTGNQPLLVGQLNATAAYPIDWAQVPTSWEVDDAGLEVEGPIVSLQVYLDGTTPGLFDICVSDLAPLSAEEISFDAPPAGQGLNGFLTFDEARLKAEYDLWKTRHFHDCGDGSACVPRTDEGDCISEGIGYGMLLTAAFDDQSAFDKLWQYFKNNRRSTGMMNWQTNVCGAGISDGAATDGDLDAAMALIQAGCAWGGTYAEEAATLIRAIETNAVANCTNGSVIKPGDNFGGCNETNPSYVAPAYYRIFQEATGNTVWSTLLDSGYTLLQGNQTRKAGVFSDWSNDTGGLATAGTHSDDFGPDASRVPWRLVTDYAWNGETRAIDVLDTFRERVEAEGGPTRAFEPNSMFRGASALSAMVADGATAQEYTEAWLLTTVDDETYFPGTLRPLYLLLAANQFSKSCQ